MTLVLMCSGNGGDSDDTVAAATGVEEMCRRPDSITELAAGRQRLALVLHRDQYDLSSVQTAARSAGIDPLGVQIVHHDEMEDAAEFAALVMAAAARAEAYVDSEPEHAKPVFATTLSRRALLRKPLPEYVAVPFIDQGTCVAGNGCKVCVATCPTDAYHWGSGRVSFDKQPCISCGQCVTACPVGAISNPTITPLALRSQIECIVAESATPAGIAFTCSHGRAGRMPASWYPVMVPCTIMIPPTWMLGALLLGAAGVTATTCERSDGLAALEFAKEILAGAGTPADAVALAPEQPPPPRDLTLPVEDPFSVHGPVEVLLALAAMAQEGVVATEPHRASPVGIVTINEDTCTLCTRCAQACPTGAMAHGAGADSISLSFDAALCTACNQCLSACPEVHRGAIAVRHSVDSELLAAGRKVVNSGATLTCATCGGPIAPAGMMDRIADLLGPEHSTTMEFLAGTCMSCRGL